MINVDLLKEVKEKSQQRQEADDTIVQQVQKLLDTKGQEEREILRKSGLNHHINIAEDIQGEAIERKTFFDKYGDSLTVSEVEAICRKYALRCLKIDMYKGNIGPNVSSDIKRFVDKHKLHAELDSGNFRRQLYIMAPKEAFKLKARPKDPVLFYNPNEYSSYGKKSFIPVSKWGNDFTFLRVIKGLFNHAAFLVFLVISVITAGLSIICNSYVPVFIVYGIISAFLFRQIFFVTELSKEELEEWFSTGYTYDPLSEFKD